jgi:hypothetical protein
MGKIDPKQKLSKVTKRKKSLADDVAKLKEPAPGLKLTHVNGKPIDAPASPRQPTLPAPGMAPKVHPDINAAAQELAVAKEKAKSAADFKKLKESVLVSKMKAHGETHYVDRGLNIEVTLSTTDKITLKQFDHDDESTDYE